jgi:UrcA family protein
MRRILLRVVVGVVASALISGIAAAQNLEEITVQAKRILNTKTVGQSNLGAPILDVSLSYGVRIGDLDLASHYGPIELEKRIHDAAVKACKEIGRQYPDSTPSDDECAKAAADKAMVKAHELIDAAGKKSAK